MSGHCLVLKEGLQSVARCFQILLVLTVIWISCLYLFFFRDNFHIVRTINSLSRKPPTGCIFPSADPFAPALNSVVKKHPPLDCSKKTPNIVYIEANTLKVNHSKVNANFRLRLWFSHCRYKEVVRKKNQDKDIEYTWFSQNFTDSIQLPLWHENIVSECFDDKGTVLSRSYLPLVRKKPKTEKLLDKRYQAHQKKHSPSDTLSILMIGIDGMSKQNFERAMPQTRNFLLEKMGAIEMHKFNKLAYETFSNVLGLLTGHSRQEFLKDWHYNQAGFVDQINDAFLWTTASKIGYRTGLIMDYVNITAFHYQKKGFGVSPVDYYQRATVIASNEDKLMRGGNANCIGDLPEVTQLYDYWLQMVSTFGKNRTTPFFGYSFAARLTHDDDNLAHKGDNVYYKFLKDLVATNSLENTVIIWFSDHGPRFGAIRATYHGKIETNTPYMFFVFPPWFKEKYPELISTLKINQHRLASHFDVHETIRDILFLDGKKKRPGTLEERGISLFREIPRERNCTNAGIPEEFCACGTFFEPRVTNETLSLLGLTLLNKINSFLGFEQQLAPKKSSAFKNILHRFKYAVPFKKSDSSAFPVSEKSQMRGPSGNKVSSYSAASKHAVSSPDVPSSCARLNLVKVENLYEVTNAELNGMKAKSYRVTIRTDPGSGLFEAMLNYDKLKERAEVIGDVVRLNFYRGQADCVHDPWFRQFCYCV